MSNYIFQECFSTYEQAFDFCEKSNIGKKFPADVWQVRQLEFLRKSRLGISPRAESISEILAKEKDLKIVDFGGGSGWLFQYLKALGYDANCLAIVETDESISWFNKGNIDSVWKTNKELTELELNGQKEVFYSNSCIQYVDKIEPFLGLILKKPWTYLILEDIPNLENRDIWTCQNYYGYLSPYHFFNINSLISLIENFGFKLTLNSEYQVTYPADWRYLIEEKDSVIAPEMSRTLIFSSVK